MVTLTVIVEDRTKKPGHEAKSGKGKEESEERQISFLTFSFRLSPFLRVWAFLRLGLSLLGFRFGHLFESVEQMSCLVFPDSIDD